LRRDTLVVEEGLQIELSQRRHQVQANGNMQGHGKVSRINTGVAVEGIIADCPTEN